MNPRFSRAKHPLRFAPHTTPLPLLVGVAILACDRASDGPPAYRIPEIGISIPRLSGWIVDSSVRLQDVEAGGVAFRLVRENAVATSPRIDVIIEPRRPHPTQLEEFLTQNLREMAKYEKGGAVRILHVSQRPVSVGPRRGYRVRHEYITTPKEGAAPMSITQVSTLFVLDGRGITVTAPGQTELFRPLADSINRVMTGLSVPVPSGRTLPVSAEPETLPKDVEPIDLGTVGGKQ